MNRTFWIAALVAFINALSTTILIPVIYLYGRQFGLNNFQTSLLFSMYAVAQFFATPVIGKLADRFGRKPLLIISLAGTVIANLLAGTATAVVPLFLARFLDGITGGNNSVAQAIIADVTTPADRARGFGIFGAAFGMGFILGPAISLLAQKISLGTAFLVSAAIALIALLITVFLLPETLSNQPSEPQQSNQRSEPPQWFDLGLGNLVKGLALPGVGILLIINFFIGTTFTISTYGFQPYFINVLGQDSQSLTLMFLIFGALGVIMQTWGVAKLTHRLSVSRIFLLALGMRSLSFSLMPIWHNIYYFVAISILFSLLNSLVQPMLNTLISLNAKPEEQGMVMGLNSSYLGVSNAFGPVIAGLIMNQAHLETYSYPLYLAGGLTFLVFLLAIRTRDQYTPRNT